MVDGRKKVRERKKFLGDLVGIEESSNKVEKILKEEEEVAPIDAVGSLEGQLDFLELDAKSR
jgi:hypothetical protein